MKGVSEVEKSGHGKRELSRPDSQLIFYSLSSDYCRADSRRGSMGTYGRYVRAYGRYVRAYGRYVRAYGRYVRAYGRYLTAASVLKFRGTKGNAVPVRKLQPHLEGTIVPFKTHRPQSLPQRISSGAFCSQFHLCVATSADGCLTAIYDTNQNFPVSVVPYFSLTMN